MKSLANKSLIKPPKLNLGDTVALVSPGRWLPAEKIEHTKAVIRKLGFCVATYPLVDGRARVKRFFAADDQARALELHWAMSQPGISAVLSCRAGYGSQRLIDRLTPQQLKQWEPKIFLGYSDITFLHQWIQNQLGWVTYHGPLVGFESDAALRLLLSNLSELSSLKSTYLWKSTEREGATKTVRGRLVGGNLSLIQTSGPAALPKNESLVLALEDVNEDFYRLDRMIWNLIHAGYDKNVKAILLGHFQSCGKNDSKAFGWARVRESLRRLSAGPIWHSCPFGHGLKRQVILPLGARVEVSGRGIKLLEAVVS